MKVSFDLDSVIFNLKPIYQLAFRDAGVPYTKPTHYDLYKDYDPVIADNIIALFSDDILYQMPVLDSGIPMIINSLIARPDMDVVFVTERRLKQPQKTYAQLRNAGINCTFDQVYDKPGAKPDILKSFGPDVHFDDGPHVVSGCLELKVPIVMISNNSTLYNHHLRPYVPHYNCLRTALIKTGIYQPQKTR